MQAARGRRSAEPGQRVSASVAITLFGLTVLLTAAYGPLYARVSPLSPHPFAFPGAASIGGLAFASMGLLVAVRQRRNPLGWVMLAAGVLLQAVSAAQLYALLAYRGGDGQTWAAPISVWLGSTLWAPGLGLLPVGLLLFPDGTLTSRRWRVALVAVIALNVIFVAALVAFVTWTMARGPISVGPDGQLAVLGDNSAAASSALGRLFIMTVPLFIASFVVGAAGLVVHTVQAHGERREQMKWFASAAAVGALGIAAFGVAQLATGSSSVLTHATAGFFILALSTLPVATAVAIFKYHLYDIDVVISRTFVYGTLAVLITGIYVGIAVGVGELVGSGGRPNLGLSILATAIVAVGFQPARAALQRMANRLVYGNRASPYQVLSEFSSQVAGSAAADEVLPRVARLLLRGTAAESATVWLRAGDSLRPAAEWPAAASNGHGALAVIDDALPALPNATRAVEVRHHGELLGALSVTKRRNESLTPVEEKLLDDIAHQAGLVLKNVGLTADLQRRLEELRASRQRLVSAQDAERRRLERNLHDGAQQHLVALKVKLGLAQMLAAKDPAKANATLEELKADADEALETLRDLARGIYPPLLAEKGLPTALRAQAQRATVDVSVDSDGVGRYSQDIEATVYFCVLETLQNIQKYADASHVVVRLRERDGTLQFDVSDDGRGFDPATVRRGTGLTNMLDRLDAIGGSLSITSHPGGGALVSGRVPVAVGQVVA